MTVSYPVWSFSRWSRHGGRIIFIYVKVFTSLPSVASSKDVIFCLLRSSPCFIPLPSKDTLLLSVSFLAVSPHRQGAIESNKVGPRGKDNKKKSEQRLTEVQENILKVKWKKEKSQHIIREKSRLKVKLYLMSWTDWAPWSHKYIRVSAHAVNLGLQCMVDLELKTGESS